MSNARNVARILANSNGELLAGSIPPVAGSKVSSILNYSSLPTGTALQMRSTLYTSYNSMSINNGWYSISGISVIITPRYKNSLIRIDVRWMGEVESAWDVVFGVTRNGLLINAPTQEGARNLALGVPCQSYVEDDNNSTLEFCQFSTLDIPNTTAPLTYQLVARSNAARTMYTGRVFNSSYPQGNYEQGSTEIIATEYAG